MTQAQKDKAEAVGFVLIALGTVLWLRQPWLLLILGGVLLVVFGNTGKAHNDDSP